MGIKRKAAVKKKATVKPKATAQSRSDSSAGSETLIVGKVEGISTDEKHVVVTLLPARKRKVNEIFYFPPNSERMLAELKRAQNHNFNVEINYTRKNGFLIIETITVRGSGK